MAAFDVVARLEDIPDGEMTQVVVRGELVGLYRVGEHIFAVNDICTHEEAYLTDGDFDPDELEVECPLHGSRFNIETGDVRILPATRPIATYEVRVDDGEVSVGPKRSRE